MAKDQQRGRVPIPGVGARPFQPNRGGARPLSGGRGKAPLEALSYREGLEDNL